MTLKQRSNNQGYWALLTCHQEKMPLLWSLKVIRSAIEPSSSPRTTLSRGGNGWEGSELSGSRLFMQTEPKGPRNPIAPSKPERNHNTPLQRSICTVSKCFNDFASFGIFMTFHDHFLSTLPWPRLRNALRGLRKPGAHRIGSKSRFHLCLSETMKHPPHRCTCGFDMTFVCSYQTGNKKARDGDGTVFEALRKGTALEKGFRDLSSILLYRQERNCCNLYKIDLYLSGYLTLAKVHCSEGQVMKLHPLSLSQRCRQTGQRFQLCFFINSRMAGSIRFSSASSQLSRWDGWVHAAQKLCLHWGQFTLAARCSCSQGCVIMICQIKSYYIYN